MNELYLYAGLLALCCVTLSIWGLYALVVRALEHVERMGYRPLDSEQHERREEALKQARKLERKASECELSESERERSLADHWRSRASAQRERAAELQRQIEASIEETDDHRRSVPRAQDSQPPAAASEPTEPAEPEPKPSLYELGMRRVECYQEGAETCDRIAEEDELLGDTLGAIRMRSGAQELRQEAARTDERVRDLEGRVRTEEA